MANKLHRSMHRRCLRDFHCFFNNPLCSPFLRVTFRQRTKFGQIFITPILRKTFFIKRKRADIAYLEVICCGSQHYIYNDSFYTFIKSVR